MHVRAILTGTIAALLLASAAHATPPARDPAAAEVLFRDARARMEAGDYAHARLLFAESLRLDFAAGTLLNLAACEEQLGQLASAWQHFSELLERLPPGDDRRGLAADRLGKLEPRVPRLTLVLSAGAGDGAKVTRDEVELGAASLGVALPVDPGEHTVVVSARGRETRRRTIHIADGEKQVVTVEPGPPSADAVVSPGSGMRTAGWLVGTVGVTSLAVGTYFGVQALAKRSDSDAVCSGGICRDAAGAQAYEDARTYSRVSDVTLGVGVVAVAVAVYLIVASPRDHASSSHVAVHVLPSGIGGSW